MGFLFQKKIFADDAHVECYGGGAGTVNSDRQYYVIAQDEDIAMTAEHVLITMYEDYYTVDAKFWLTAEGFEGKTAVNARSDFTKAFLNYDLCFMTEKQLRLARNDFYALHGRSFKDKELKRFYESIVGFKVNKDYSDDLLSAEEKEIVSKVLEIEKNRKRK